jgi:hypothetical protein
MDITGVWGYRVRVRPLWPLSPRCLLRKALLVSGVTSSCGGPGCIWTPGSVSALGVVLNGGEFGLQTWWFLVSQLRVLGFS